MTDKAKEQEQVVFAAYYQYVLQNGLIATDLTELARIARELLGEGAAFNCMTNLDRWQIRKVKLVDADSVVVPRKLMEWVEKERSQLEHFKLCYPNETWFSFSLDALEIILPRQEKEG